MEKLVNPMNQMKSNVASRWKYLAGLWVIVLVSTVFFFNYTGIPKKLVVVVGLLASAVIVLYGKNLAKNTFIIVVATGLLFSFITPVMDVPDETAHLSRTIYISEGHLGVSKDISTLNISDDYLEVVSRNGATFRNDLKDLSHTDKKSNQSTAVALTSIYSVIGYLPQVLGWSFGKLFNLNLFWTFYLGRIFNVLAYAVLAYFSVKIAKQWKPFMAVLTTFPMVVYLAASYNQDGVANGIIFLALAVFINMAAGEDKIRLKDVAIYLLLCMVIVTGKLPYVLIAGFLVFLEPRKFESKKIYALMLGGVLAAAVFTLLWYGSATGIDSFKPEGANPQKQMEFLMSHPSMIVKVSLDGVINVISKYMETFRLGWLSYSSDHVAILYLMFFSSVFVLYPIKKIKLTLFNKAGIISVCLGIIAGIVMSQYLNWTPVESQDTLGVQGRYFIGLFALLPLFINVSSLFYREEAEELPLEAEISTSRVKAEDPWLVKQSVWLSSMSLYFVVMMILLTLSVYYKGI